MEQRYLSTEVMPRLKEAQVLLDETFLIYSHKKHGSEKSAPKFLAKKEDNKAELCTLVIGYKKW